MGKVFQEAGRTNTLDAYGAPVYVDICGFVMMVVLFAMTNFVAVITNRDGTNPNSPKNPTIFGVLRTSNANTIP